MWEEVRIRAQKTGREQQREDGTERAKDRRTHLCGSRGKLGSKLGAGKSRDGAPLHQRFQELVPEKKIGVAVVLLLFKGRGARAEGPPTTYMHGHATAAMQKRRRSISVHAAYALLSMIPTSGR